MVDGVTVTGTGVLVNVGVIVNVSLGLRVIDAVAAGCATEVAVGAQEFRKIITRIRIEIFFIFPPLSRSAASFSLLTADC
jgi:hypothetical protein